jgi:hypothetical protein
MPGVSACASRSDRTGGITNEARLCEDRTRKDGTPSGKIQSDVQPFLPVRWIEEGPP